MSSDLIGKDFVERYQRFWSAGALDVNALYAREAVLCGYEIVKGHDAIGKLLGAIHAQGWSTIEIHIVESVQLHNALLLACEYVARSESDSMNAKSSYTLVQEDGLWKVAMHTAT